MWDLIVSVPDHCLSFYFPRILIITAKHVVKIEPIKYLGKYMTMLQGHRGQGHWTLAAINHAKETYVFRAWYRGCMYYWDSLLPKDPFWDLPSRRDECMLNDTNLNNAFWNINLNAETTEDEGE